MVKTKKKDLMMVSLDKGIELYLSTLAPEGKSPRYIDRLNTRLRFFNDFISETYGEDSKLRDLTVEDGRAYIGSLMERNTRYQNHPTHQRKKKGNSKSSMSTVAVGLFALSRPVRMRRNIWMKTSCAG